MRLPTVSIMTLIVLIGVVAADCLVWRDEAYTTLPPVDSKEPFLGLILPMINAVVIGGFVLIGQVVRKGACGSALFGFVTSGCLVVLALVIAYWARGGWIDAYLALVKGLIDRVLRSAGLVHTIGDYYTPFWHDWGTPAIVCAVISAPTFVVAGLGGWVFDKAGVQVVRRGA